MSTFAHVSAVSINQTVGDWAGNKARIISAIEEAKNSDVPLVYAVTNEVHSCALVWCKVHNGYWQGFFG